MDQQPGSRPDQDLVSTAITRVLIAGLAATVAGRPP
jgi:hypothetical protein